MQQGQAMITSASSQQAQTCVLITAFLAGLLSMPTATTAQTTSWIGSFSHPDNTTHWYEAVPVAGGLSWGEANRAAATAGGHLATITSAEEHAVVVALIQDASLWSGSEGPWIGGLRSVLFPSVWGWTELEPFSFSAWAQGQPASEVKADRLHFGGSTTTTVGTWAGAPAKAKHPGYVIEYDGPTARRTIGLLRQDTGSFEGYTLFNPSAAKETYLVDHRGRTVNSWISAYPPGMSAYLLPNGNMLRCGAAGNTVFTAGGNGGVVEEFAWDGSLVWYFQHSNDKYCLHHDIEKLPNGNVLMIAWELKTKEEAIAAGRDPKLLTQDAVWPEKIIEVQATGKDTGKIVWEWHVWDHLVQDLDSTKANYGDVAKNPQLVDLNYTLVDGGADWLHANSVAYNAKLDQIVVSFRHVSEIWIIDHSTSTAEAASHSGGKSGKGGDLLYRWGNPAAYRAGTAKEQTLFYQHDAHWIPEGLHGAGNMMIFNNGYGRDYSSVDELALPSPDAKGNYPMTSGVWGPTAPKWSYTAPTKENFFALFVSGAHRLPNGNTLICSGVDGLFFEVTDAGKIVWEYQNPVSTSIAQQGDPTTRRLAFRATRYAADYPGLKGKTLTPKDPIEKHDSVLLVEGSTVPHRAQLNTAVRFSLRAGNYPGQGYLVGTSLKPGLLQVDFRFMRVGWDPILAVSILQTAPAVFQNYIGLLDGNGHGSAALAIPDIQDLIGLKLYTAFVVDDLASRSGLGMISNTVVVEIGS